MVQIFVLDDDNDKTAASQYFNSNSLSAVGSAVIRFNYSVDDRGATITDSWRPLSAACWTRRKGLGWAKWLYKLSHKSSL